MEKVKWSLDLSGSVSYKVTDLGSGQAFLDPNWEHKPETSAPIDTAKPIKACLAEITEAFEWLQQKPLLSRWDQVLWVEVGKCNKFLQRSQ